MTPATDDKDDSIFLCVVGEKAMIMCLPHAQTFELTMIATEVPHTIWELDDDDKEGKTCQACDLHNELTRPRLILPN